MKKTTRETLLKDVPLRDFFVWWDDLAYGDLEKLEIAIESAEREEDIQKIITEIPLLLVQHLHGGGGRWVLPKKRLGVEYVTDFIIGERHSFGFDWVAVELESPKVKMFTTKGDPTKELTHAIRQIQDWRTWIKNNRDYAIREINKQGLGLTDIDSNIPGLILIGRRKDVDKSTDELRRQMVQDSKIVIHTYDYLIDSAKSRVEWCEKERKKHIECDTQPDSG
jgi:hypothetical protein